MADETEVKLGYDASGVKKGADEATKAAKESFRSIADGLKAMATGSKDAEGVMADALRGIGRSFANAATNASAGSKAIVGSFTVAAAGIGAAVLTMGAAFGLAMKGIGDLREEAANINQLQRVFGMTSEEASRMNVALQLAGKTADDYTAIALKLGIAIRSDEARINALGVKTREANGAFLAQNDVLQNAFATMQTYKAGVDQNEFALEVFGRSARDVYGYFDVNGSIMERAAQLQRELNIEMGPEKRAAIKAYAVESRAMGIVWGEVRQSLAESLMPTLKALTGWFASIAPAAMTVFSVALKALITALEGFGAVIASVAIAGVAAFENLMQVAGALGRAFLAFIRGEWGAIPDIMRASSQRSEAINAAAADGVRNAWSNSYQRIKSLWSTPPAAAGGGADKQGSGTRSWTAKPAAGGGAAESRLGMFDAMLKAERDAYERMKLDQGSFERWSETQTSAFWEKIKATYQLSTKELQDIDGRWYDAQRKVRQDNFESLIAGLERDKQAIRYDYEARVRIAEQQARLIAQAYGAGSKEAIAAEARLTQEVEKQSEQRTRIYEIEARQRQATAEHAVSMAQLQANQDIALRRVTAEQAFKIEEDLENRLFAIRDQALREQRALERDPVKIAQLNAQIEAGEQEHQSRMTEIANRAELERKQAALDAARAVQDAFSGLLQGLMSNIRNWRDAFKSAIASLTSALNKLAADQIAKQFLGPGTGGNNVLSGIFGKIFGGGAVGTPGINPNGGGLAGAAGSTAEAAASTAVTTAKTAEAAASTAVTAASTAQVATATAFELALTAMTTAATSAAAALTAVATSSTANAGSSLFGSLFGGGVPALAVGTPYVPQDTLAVVHKGEAVIPAKYNKGGAGGGMSINQQFHINGPVDTRTQYQIAEQAARGARIASLRAGG
jgi:hypothetical protein